MENKKLFIVNGIFLVLFVIMFIVQWAIMKSENYLFVMIYMAVLVSLGLAFMVVSTIIIIKYVKNLNSDLKNINEKLTIDDILKKTDKK